MDLPTVACELRNRFDGTVKFQTRVKIMVLLKCPVFLEKEGDGKDVSMHSPAGWKSSSFCCTGLVYEGRS